VKRRRLIFLACVSVGVLLLEFDRPVPIETMPLSGHGQIVHLPIYVRFSGTYFLNVLSPALNAPHKFEFGPDEACDILLRIEDGRSTIINQEIATIHPYSLTGYKNVTEYRGGKDFVLARGKYLATIEGGVSCDLRASRGAAVSIERRVMRPTETYLISEGLRYLAGALVGIGLCGLLVTELRDARS
jgi:hypothetical protein